MTATRKREVLALRRYRENEGLTRKELADKIGVSEAAVGRWENLKSSPNYKSIVSSSRILKISPEELMQKEEIETSSPRFHTGPVRRMRLIREQQDVPITQVAQATGLTYTSIARLEMGGDAHFDTVSKLCKYYGDDYTIEYLMEVVEQDV